MTTFIKNTKQKAKNFLRWSQKYTQTDMVYLAKGGSWLTFGQLISTAISFLLAVTFANLLDPATYGKYKYILSLTGIFGISTLMGIETAIVQAVSRNIEGSFYTGFKTRFKWGLFGSLAAIGLAGYYFLRGNYTLPIPLLIAAIFMPLMYASRIYGFFLMGRKLFDIGAKYSILNQIIFVGVMITTLFLTKNLFWLIAAYFISSAFLSCLFYLLTKNKFKPNKKEDPQTIAYGKHLSLMGAIDAAGKYLDKMLLFVFIGPVEVAIYSFAMAIPDRIRGILGNISELALPKLTMRSQEEIKMNIMKKVGKLFLLTGAIIAAYFLVAPFIYKTFFPQYLASIFYSQLFIFSLLSIPTSLLSATFLAKIMKKELYLLRFIGIMRLILLLVLVPIYGILGAVLAMVGAQIFGAVLTFVLFHFSSRYV